MNEWLNIYISSEPASQIDDNKWLDKIKDEDAEDADGDDDNNDDDDDDYSDIEHFKYRKWDCKYFNYTSTTSF